MMINHTIARPYAKAVLEQALAPAQLDEWYRVLFVLAKTIENKTFSQAINNPSFSSDQKLKWLSNIYKKTLPKLNKTLSHTVDNFIKLLLAHKRLFILPGVLEVYQQLVYAHKKISIIHIRSAFSLSAGQKEKLELALKTYFNSTVNIHYTVNRSLIGGLIIQSKDLLIDASIKNQLKRLKYHLIQT